MARPKNTNSANEIKKPHLKFFHNGGYNSGAARFPTTSVNVSSQVQSLSFGPKRLAALCGCKHTGRNNS
ncbi:hypothetical protein T265_06190 [Opisthorchis viverrini]|uniref:Uncharacterized protein n=1 Tax=Opisthorchis viverrini TaxID=6198 RepID=A0A075AEC5_OPIVI|nr:hypothetical protein T265_06190 [Opisthorchis viverrini]KER26619.1 hypothetical protein T265_06190 [Opisthorchis viverrini]